MVGRKRSNMCSIYYVVNGQLPEWEKYRLARRMTRIPHTLSSKTWAATSSNFVFTNYVQ